MGDDSLLAPLEVPPAYAAVVDRLRRSIALGIVAPGERLPSERALSTGLGVSRVTVREALRVLQGQGLIVTKRGGSGGAIVTPLLAHSGDALADASVRNRIERVFEFRLAVETMAARLAAQRRGDADVAILARCQEAVRASERSGDFRRADSTFHLAVADASGNPMLRQSIEDARAVAFNVLDARPFRVLREATAAGHGAVLDAIAARRPDAAAEAMAEHLDVARRELFDALFGDA